MRCIVFLFFGFAAFSSLPAQTVPPRQVGLSPERLSTITDYLQRHCDDGSIAGAVAAISRHGRVGYLQAVGKSDLQRGAPMPDDALFRIASMTKAITSAATMSLVEDGVISLDDPVSKFLPEFGDPPVLFASTGNADDAIAPITVHDLLTHRSGLTYGWFGPEALDKIYANNQINQLFEPTEQTIGDRVKQIAEVPLKFEPGTAWDYSVSTDVLGRVIEVASGLPLDRFFRERFLRPLRMNDTFFYVPTDKQSRLATLYTVDANNHLEPVGTKPIQKDFFRFSADYCTAPGEFFSGGGGLVSSTNDYLRFLHMLLRGGELDGVRVLQRESVEAMTRNQIGDMTIYLSGHGDGFGFGFGVVTDRGADTNEFSAGTYSWGGIFNTYFWVDPQEELIGVLMTQIFPHDHLTIRDDFRKLAYAAIDESGFSKLYTYQPGEEYANPHFNGRQLRVNAAEVSTHPEHAGRSEPRSSGMARIRVDEDLRKIRRADLDLEVWGGHPGTTNKRVTINGRSTHRFPEVGCSEHACTHQYPSFNLRPIDLVNGYNSLQFACDTGETFWGHYIVDRATLRIGWQPNDERLVDVNLAGFDAKVVAESVTDGEGFRLGLDVPEKFHDQISSITYQAHYLGFDESGDGYRAGWHRCLPSDSDGAVQLTRTLSEDPPPTFHQSFSTRMLPSQQRVRFRAIVGFIDQPDLQYQTTVTKDFSIPRRVDEEVQLYASRDLPYPFWSRDNNTKECTINLDIDPDDIVEAELHVVAWTGGAGEVGEYFTLNGKHFPIAEGHGHDTVYSRLAVSPKLLRRGANKFILRSDTTHHGIEIMLPGPALMIRRSNALTPVVDAAPATDSDDSIRSQMRADELYQFALKQDGDPTAGERLFRDQRTKCLTCHRVGKEGGVVGPDLSNIGGKFDRPNLVDSLLYPSRQIGYGYETTIVLTTDGRTVSGVVKASDDSHITMLDSNGQRFKIAKDDIEESKVSKASIMPSGLVDSLDANEFVDLIAYLERLGRGVGKGGDITGPIQLPDGFELTTIASGLSGAVAMDIAPDGRIFICEQGGTLKMIRTSSAPDASQTIDKAGPTKMVDALTIPVELNWERGLIGVTVAPSFPSDPHIYVVYVTDKPHSHHRVSRFTVSGNTVDPTSELILLTGDDQSKFGGNKPSGHQGGAIHFGPDGKLYVGIGEQTAGDPAQRMDALQGKILRLNPDGSIPGDNPFVNETTGKYRSIWAKGCRNPFTFAFSRSGKMFINDVGGKFEEINRGIAGANYGWPGIDHGPTNRKDIVSPIHSYPQSCINGGDFCDESSPWPKLYHGKYFFADFNQGWVRYIDPDSPAKSQDFLAGIRRPVDLRFGPDGSLYVLLRNAWVVDKNFQGGTGALLKVSSR